MSDTLDSVVQQEELAQGPDDSGCGRGRNEEQDGLEVEIDQPQVEPSRPRRRHRAPDFDDDHARWEWARRNMKKRVDGALAEMPRTRIIKEEPNIDLVIYTCLNCWCT